MSLTEAAEKYGRSRQTLHSARARGRLKATKVGNQYQVTDEQMQEYLDTMSPGWRLRNQRAGLPMPSSDPDAVRLRLTVDVLDAGEVWQVEVASGDAVDPAFVATTRRLRPPTDGARTDGAQTMPDAARLALQRILEPGE